MEPPTIEGETEPWEEEFKKYPTHLQFFRKLRNAQETANTTGKRSQICWRGHRTSVGPKEGGLSKKEYMLRLTTALKNIRSVTSEEKEVKHIFKLFLLVFSIINKKKPQFSVHN